MWSTKQEFNNLKGNTSGFFWYVYKDHTIKCKQVQFNHAISLNEIHIVHGISAEYFFVTSEKCLALY